MAQFERTVHGNIDTLKNFINRNSQNLGVTLVLEEELSGTVENVDYWVGAFERYAMLGGNRVSLNVILLEAEDGVKVIATSTGGSQGALLKINYWSEDNFINDFASVMDAYEKQTFNKE